MNEWDVFRSRDFRCLADIEFEWRQSEGIIGIAPQIVSLLVFVISETWKIPFDSNKHRKKDPFSVNYIIAITYSALYSTTTPGEWRDTICRRMFNKSDLLASVICKGIPRYILSSFIGCPLVSHPASRRPSVGRAKETPTFNLISVIIDCNKSQRHQS